MTPILETPRKSAMPWVGIVWFGVLVLSCYAFILKALVRQWSDDPDMGHGFFVPLIAGYIIWQMRKELSATKLEPTWWGLAVVLWGAAQMFVGALGVELFLSRTALVVTIWGIVLLLGGTPILKKLLFPLLLLFFMVPIPAIIYTRITFPLQIIASKFAAVVLMTLNIPVLREGNVLELPNRSLSVVEACSGIRSLLSLTFLGVVYGYFFEKRLWIRLVLLLATVPIAIVANGSRVAITGVMTQIKPELADGFYHESTGWVIFMIALLILVLFHRLIFRAAVRFGARRQT